jgi:hypothetical protein
VDTARRFLGNVQPRLPRFGDTVVVQPPAAEPFTGDEVAELDGSPFPPQALQLSVSLTALRFVAVAPSGPRTLTVRNVGTTTNAQHTSVIVRSTADAIDRATTGCADLECEIDRAPRLAAASLPYQIFLSLSRTPPSDTLDVVAIQATSAGPRSVTAELDWHPTANLDLRWVDCVSRSRVGPTGGVTSAARERTTAPIPPGACWALLVLLASPDQTSVIARLQIRSP